MVRPERHDFDAAVRQTAGVQPWRRAFHCLGGVALVAFVELGPLARTADLALLALAAVAGFGLDALRLTRPDANLRFFRSLRALASPREARRVASSTWYATGAFLTLGIAPEGVFAPAVLVLALADPAASVVGRLWGRRPLGKGSWEGTAAFYLVAVAVLVPFAGVGAALLVAAAAAAVEVLPTGIDDNLVVPVGVVAAFWMVSLAGG